LSNKNSSGHYSPRNSLLIWVAGIVLGWGCAVVLVYQFIKGPEGSINPQDGPAIAQNKAQSMEDKLGAIEPAAGGAAEQGANSAP
jgi:hypothetical protein